MTYYISICRGPRKYGQNASNIKFLLFYKLNYRVAVSRSIELFNYFVIHIFGQSWKYSIFERSINGKCWIIF